MSKKFRFYYWYILSLIKRHYRLIILIFPLIYLLWLSLQYSYPNLFLPALAKLERAHTHQYYYEGIVGSPGVLNPLFEKTDIEKDINRLVYRSLVKVNSKGEPVPDLAEKYTVEDSKEYTFYLRQDVYWHDGKKFSADDVIHTVKLTQNPSIQGSYQDIFKDIEITKVDEYTVKFKLKEPFAPFPTTVALGIIPKHIPLNNFKPVGTGPFRVKETSKTHLTLSNDKLDVVFKYYPSYQMAIQALKLGEIHGLGGVDHEEKKIFENWPNFQVYSGPTHRRFVGIFLNTKDGPVSERVVRQALAYATPTEKIINEAIEGEGQPIYSPVSSLSWAKTEEHKKYTYNLEKSKELLEKAGWKLEGNTRKKGDKEFTLSISTVGISPYPEIAKEVAAAWESLGIKTEQRIFNTSDLKEQIVSRRQFEVLITSQEINPDPDQYVLWHSTQTDNANITALSVPKIDKALEDARKTLDLSSRKEKYSDFQKYFLEEVPVIFLYLPSFNYILSSKVKGFELVDFTVPADRFNSIESWRVEKRGI
jgi:peptide/nickel transport system substrate-binding protein